MFIQPIQSVQRINNKAQLKSSQQTFGHLEIIKLQSHYLIRLIEDKNPKETVTLISSLKAPIKKVIKILDPLHDAYLNVCAIDKVGTLTNELKNVGKKADGDVLNTIKKGLTEILDMPGLNRILESPYEVNSSTNPMSYPNIVKNLQNIIRSNNYDYKFFSENKSLIIGGKIE